MDSTQMARALSDASFEAVLMHSDGIIRNANRTAEIYAQVAPGALVGRRLLDFLAPDSREVVRARIVAGDESPIEAVALRADGTVFPVEAQARNVPIFVGGAALRVTVIRDLSARRALEEQLRQAQKMEAVGRLAGGIAHDFNNLLSVIIVSAELAIEQLPPGHPVRGDLSEVVRAGDRASGLTRQLLAFSRKQVLREQVLDLNEVLGGMHSMIKRLIGEDVVLQVHPGPRPALLKADLAQLEQVVMNLVVNARDAMPRGGRLTLAADALDVTDEEALRLELRPGPHVTLTIADTGSGMDDATKSRLFEPFFTTKGPGEGTGLGLSTVFGIVKQSRGAVRVDSTVGVGSTFVVYFPRTEEELLPELTGRPGRSGPTLARSVLVVEDEPQLRRVVVHLLRRAGYEVSEARGPAEALEIAQRYAGPIDLLLTDVVMPQMNGRELASRFAVLRPDTVILLMSGYTDIPVGGRSYHFLAKPVVPDTLLAKVRSLVG